MDEFTNYELEVAKLITDNPGVLCLDVLGIFKYAPDPYHPAIKIETRDEEGEFSYNTSRVDVCMVELPTAKEREFLNRKFKFKFIFKIASDVTMKNPDAETIIINNLPVTEEQVIFVCKTYLKAVGYEQPHFIWGNRMIGLE
jgi:hypothetical protein